MAVLYIVRNVVDDLHSVFGIGIPRTFLFKRVEVCVWSADQIGQVWFTQYHSGFDCGKLDAFNITVRAVENVGISIHKFEVSSQIRIILDLVEALADQFCVCSRWLPNAYIFEWTCKFF